MEIYLHNKDVLDVTEADTLALPVDGAARKLVGSVTHQFLKRIGEGTLGNVFAPPLEYPFTGCCRWTRIEGGYPQTHFDFICALGTLSHAAEIDHAAVARSAFREMLEGLSSGGVGSKIAIPVLTGGHRLQPLNALNMMLREAEHTPGLSGMELHIT